MDIEKIKQSADIVEVISRAVSLKREGNQYKGLCPFHSERSPSFAVNPKTQRFTCYGCGKKGDVLDFVQELEGCTLPEAAQKISGGNFTAAPVEPAVDPWQHVFPAPDNINPTHPKLGAPTKVWTYRDAEGAPLYYVMRWDSPEGSAGKKQFRPLAQFVNAKTGEVRLRWAMPSSPRPLYGLRRLAQHPSATVIVVEGEKTADAAQRLFPGAVAVTWHGGRGAVRLFDWSPLKGRRIILWPDNDYSHADSDGETLPWSQQPGNDAMLTVADLIPSPAVLRWVKNPDGLPCGWDVADADWDEAAAKIYLKANLIEVPGQEEEEEHAENPIPGQASAAPPDSLDPTALPCRALGYSMDDNSLFYWFLEARTEAVLKYSSRQLEQAHSVKELAPANFWEQHYPARTGSRIDLATIGEMLRQECHAKGYFDSDRIRGRGAWRDEGRLVFHAGDRLIAGGVQMRLPDIDSNFAYQKKKALGFTMQEPLTATEARQILDLMNIFAWERKLDAWMIAGWVALAPICGALNWRPHIWITGGAGTGKSWILQRVVRALLGNIHMAVQGKTTEPAIRQLIDSDSLPVVYDEFEAESEADLQRVQAILDLARSASSSDGGNITKGGKNGRALTYRVKSAFCFASISSTIEQYSDRSRITMLSLRRSSDAEKMANAKKVTALIQGDFSQRLHSRTIGMVDVIQANVLTLSRAIANRLGDTRVGDQLGALMAGAVSLISDEILSESAAADLVASFDWEQEKAKQEQLDEYRCLQVITEHLTSFDANGARVERTVAELVAIAIGEKLDPGVSADVAGRRLSQLGIRADMKTVYLANTSLAIKRTVMRGTPWGSSFSSILQRIPGVTALNAMRFGAGKVSRATGIPIDMLNVIREDIPEGIAVQDAPF